MIVVAVPATAVTIAETAKTAASQSCTDMSRDAATLQRLLFFVLRQRRQILPTMDTQAETLNLPALTHDYSLVL